MIRKAFIQKQILNLYKKMDRITYPIQPEKLLSYLPQQCRILTYQKMAELSCCSVNDVAILCKSDSGATHLDVEQNRCLILYNSSMNSGRVLWTLCHEIGHICLNHLEVLDEHEIAYMDRHESYSMFECEADYFAWNLIAPLPIMRKMGVKTIAEIQHIFGFSSQAAALQYDRYYKWCRSHIKTAWENNILREFCKKSEIPHMSCAPFIIEPFQN